MKITIAAVGRMKPSPEKELVTHYEERFVRASKQLGLGKLEIREVEEKRRIEGPERQALEADLLSETLPKGSTIIALDERGKQISSQAFADLLNRHLDSGTSDLAFAIGGADGLTAEFKKDAHQTISLGAATWPHMLARVLLTEQLYRAATILAGHPYHKN